MQYDNKAESQIPKGSECASCKYRESRILLAAQAVVARWDSPLWKDQPHTGEVIAELRKAISEYDV